MRQRPLRARQRPGKLGARSVVVLVLLLGAHASAATGGSVVVNVSPAFYPGPYTTLSVNPAKPDRIAIGTLDGHVILSSDGGLTTSESQILFPRKLAILALRAHLRSNLGARLDPRTGLSLTIFERGAGRLFLSNLIQGFPVVRWESWMSLDDPITEITDVALPPETGRMAVACMEGIYLSDRRGGTWMRALGLPHAKGQDVVGFAAAFDPSDPSHLLVSTNQGFFVSRNGGQTFMPHPDSRLVGEQVRNFVWNASDPKRILAVTPEAVLESSDGGKTFSAALNANDEIFAVALSPEGAYVATAKGLLIASGEGKEQTRFRDEKVVGVVPLGEGYALAATDTTLYLVSPKSARALLRTTPSDPFLRLQGTPELAWALSKYEVFRIGAREARAEGESQVRPLLRLSQIEVERAVLHRLGLHNPQNTRFADRWYAKLLPSLTVQIQGSIANDYMVAYDGTFPVRYARAVASRQSFCCGSPDGDEAMVILNWDLSKFLLGQTANVTNPNNFLEQGLRQTRDDIMIEIRWRYREMANLAHMLAHPPLNPQTAIFWQMRFEEHASYLEAISGRTVATIPARKESE